jgi:hypothetical protein
MLVGRKPNRLDSLRELKCFGILCSYRMERWPGWIARGAIVLNV